MQNTYGDMFTTLTSVGTVILDGTLTPITSALESVCGVWETPYGVYIVLYKHLEPIVCLYAAAYGSRVVHGRPLRLGMSGGTYHFAMSVPSSSITDKGIEYNDFKAIIDEPLSYDARRDDISLAQRADEFFEQRASGVEESKVDTTHYLSIVTCACREEEASYEIPATREGVHTFLQMQKRNVLLRSRCIDVRLMKNDLHTAPETLPVSDLWTQRGVVYLCTNKGGPHIGPTARLQVRLRSLLFFMSSLMVSTARSTTRLRTPWSWRPKH